jgi:hypothetical protein
MSDLKKLQSQFRRAFELFGKYPKKDNNAEKAQKAWLAYIAACRSEKDRKEADGLLRNLELLI